MRDKREKGWFWVENELIDNENLEPMERLLYMVLARHADNETSESFPSIETLCKKTGVKDKRTVVKYIKNLESMNLIEVKRTQGMPNRYYLNNVKPLVTKNVPTFNDTTLGTKNVPIPPTNFATGVGTKNVPLTIHNKKTNKKDLIKNTAEIENFFEECWKLYPSKTGKGTIKDKAKKETYKLGEEFKRCIERYIEFVEQKRKKDFPNLNWKNGSTFWNSGYIDFLDENYKNINTVKSREQLNKESEEQYGF